MSTQSDATHAIAMVAAMPNPGPGQTAFLSRMNNNLVDGINGTDHPGAYAHIVTEANRYLAFPV
jgi:hypothetical protein